LEFKWFQYINILLSDEMEKLISSFGKKERSYENIIKRIYNLAVKEQSREFIITSANSISLDEARRRHALLWQK